jgi:hypothetical protein
MALTCHGIESERCKESAYQSHAMRLGYLNQSAAYFEGLMRVLTSCLGLVQLGG